MSGIVKIFATINSAPLLFRQAYYVRGRKRNLNVSCCIELQNKSNDCWWFITSHLHVPTMGPGRIPIVGTGNMTPLKDKI